MGGRIDELTLSIADLELTGASHYRYRPLREAIAAKEGVTAEQVVAADGSARIAVTDHGRGIPAELRPRLFERFATRGGHGTGLGLHIVRELARAQDGDATYVAGDNAFVVRLPRAATAP